MKTWRVPTLINRALATSDEAETYWKCVRELHVRGTAEVFDAAVQQCRKNSNASKSLGANVLGQLGTPDRPYREPSLKILWSMLSVATSPKVLQSSLVAVGHLQDKMDARRIRLITNLANHRSELVRGGVVNALLARSDRTSVKTLILLSGDKAASVRDWATFGLGSMIDFDSPSLRKALVDRLDDSDADTRHEALVGLARRKDRRIFARLQQELEGPAPMSLVFEAAAEFGDRSLLPLLRKHQDAVDSATDAVWASALNDACEQLEKQDPRTR